MDGLAGGKGVYLPNTIDEVREVVQDNVNYIIERRLYGTEVSVLAFCNGKEAFLMPQAQDYKRIYDNDAGPNTGGMGAICPANILNEWEKLNEKANLLFSIHLN